MISVSLDMEITSYSLKVSPLEFCCIILILLECVIGGREGKSNDTVRYLFHNSIFVGERSEVSSQDFFDAVQ